MQYFQYLEISEDSIDSRRQRERDAIERSIELLTAASQAGPNSSESAEALYFTNRLWAAFADDLASIDNVNADELKARLISIALWFINEVQRIRAGQSVNFAPMIDVSRTIFDGLR
jgi:flagellar biosynthesis activator protein FlaF